MVGIGILRLGGHFVRLLGFVVAEIVEYRRLTAIGVHRLEHQFALFERNLLRVARIGHRFVFVVFQTNVSKLLVGHVFDVDPLHFEFALPLVGHVPNVGLMVVVDRRHHFGHATEMARCIDREEQVDGTFAVALTKGGVQTLVAIFCRTPNVVLDRAMNIVFGILERDRENGGKRTACIAYGFDDEESSALRT